jgi:hypothetical protein
MKNVITRVFWSPFTPQPLFQWYLQSKKFLLNLGMKCWTFDAEGSRVIIVAVHIGVVKIHVAAVEALRKKERGGEARMKLNLPQNR